MDRPELPAVFAALAELAGEPTVDRAQLLGRALKAVPDLSAWIRSERQRTVRALLDMPQHSAKTLSGPLEVTPQRVHDIAAGHRATQNRRAAAAKASTTD
ncbi:sigma-70 family RNA polymerase sigma factor [Streptomyces albidoflavus]|uniref:sigma-70 family RNA polymerase sigma factor n=1 Tax=Streptomyces albidoflavus TaxID=1886 RepID=UPI000FEE77C2|nr:sigma-70 family RNA polymerase sigma factor [Streptomyces albidoflavus]RWZ74879.1 sigma-70 family RNA polymerase sigma factor [Streptomyces albidoflavus]